MDLSTFGDEAFTEKNSTKISYTGHEERVLELSPIDIVASTATLAVTLYFEDDITGECFD